MKKILPALAALALLTGIWVSGPALAQSTVEDLTEHGAWLDANPEIADAMANPVNLEPAAKQAAAYGHSHHHTDCLYTAQLIINYVDPGGTINQWPWALTGFRTPFLFYGDTHTQCEIKNSFYGYPDYTWVLLNIDHTPVDAGTHDWAFVPVGSF